MFARARLPLLSAMLALAFAACGGGGPATVPSPTQNPPPGSGSPVTTAGLVGSVDVPLSTSHTTVALPLGNGYSGSLVVHSATAPAGTKLSLGIDQPAADTTQSTRGTAHACPTSVTIKLFNPFPFPITFDVDAFTIHVPCAVTGTLFGASFYQLKPAPTTVSSTKLGDATATAHSISFTPAVASLTLPANTLSAITIAPETSTSAVALPVIPNTNSLLTSNAPSTITSSLSVNYSNSSGGGSLYSSACFPAFTSPGERDLRIASAIIEGIPSYFCQLGTVNSATLTFGTTVTFTIGSPIPDRSFIGLDGPGGEFVCDTSASPVCNTPQFTVPTIQNVIAGNVQDLQACVPVTDSTDCNSNGNTGTPAPTATSVPAKRAVYLLVADDPTYVSPGTPSCTSPSICGGFTLDTSAGSCVINNGPDENGDVPSPPPSYKDPGGPQESPAVSSGTSTHAYFPAAGPYAEFDLIAGASGTTCSVTVTESDGPLQRSTTLNLPVI